MKKKNGHRDRFIRRETMGPRKKYGQRRWRGRTYFWWKKEWRILLVGCIFLSASKIASEENTTIKRAKRHTKKRGTKKRWRGRNGSGAEGRTNCAAAGNQYQNTTRPWYLKFKAQFMILKASNEWKSVTGHCGNDGNAKMQNGGVYGKARKATKKVIVAHQQQANKPTKHTIPTVKFVRKNFSSL